MPIIKSAKKKMRKDARLTKMNLAKRNSIKGLIKRSRIDKTSDSFAKAASALDKAVKTHLIHKNKANRLKSRLAKLMASVTA